jgi:CubicO group peptidase (beta-lactamase class C family)
MSGIPILTARTVDGTTVEADSDAPVPWWSFGKTALAAAALALVRDRRLQLDGPIPGRPWSLRQLLQHTAGLPEYGTLPAYHAAVARGDEPWPDKVLLSRIEAGKLLFAPGVGWSYSNVGYLLLRRLIEATSGLPLDTALERLLWRPLAIDGVRLAQLPADLDDTAWGNPRRYHPGWVYHGLLVGPPAAAVRFLHRLVTGNFLPPDLADAMRGGRELNVPVAGRPVKSPAYGLGVMQDVRNDGMVRLGHTGQGPGSACAVYHFPSRRPQCTAAVFVLADDAESQGFVERQAVSLAICISVYEV